jgi:hypothetical protein
MTAIRKGIRFKWSYHCSALVLIDEVLGLLSTLQKVQQFRTRRVGLVIDDQRHGGHIHLARRERKSVGSNALGQGTGPPTSSRAWNVNAIFAS